MNPRIFAAYQEDEEQDVGHKRLEEPESAAGVEDVKALQVDLPLKPDHLRVNVHGLEEPGFGVDMPYVECRTFKKTRVDLHNVVNVRQFLGLVQIGEVHVRQLDFSQIGDLHDLSFVLILYMMTINRTNATSM